MNCNSRIELLPVPPAADQRRDEAPAELIAQEPLARRDRARIVARVPFAEVFGLLRLCARGDLLLRAGDNVADLGKPPLLAVGIDACEPGDEGAQHVDGGPPIHAALQELHGEGGQRIVVDEVINPRPAACCTVACLSGYELVFRNKAGGPMRGPDLRVSPAVGMGMLDAGRAARPVVMR